MAAICLPDGLSRREPDIADRDGGRRIWAESAPCGVASGRTAVGAKAAVPLGARNSPHRPQRNLRPIGTGPPTSGCQVPTALLRTAPCRKVRGTKFAETTAESRRNLSLLGVAAGSGTGGLGDWGIASHSAGRQARRTSGSGGRRTSALAVQRRLWPGLRSFPRRPL